MSLPEMIELSQVEFVTIDTIGPPGQRTFYLQAAQDEMLITLIIEKEQAAAISIAINGVLEQLGEAEDEPEAASQELIHPLEPLFRVGQLGLGYDKDRDMLVLVAKELIREAGTVREATKVHIWANRAQMAALARKATAAVTSGRPTCPLCDEVIDPDEEHVCPRGNGRKRLYETG
jgi:uncharacterized repeat protein (TIGR03847 family)